MAFAIAPAADTEEENQSNPNVLGGNTAGQSSGVIPQSPISTGGGGIGGGSKVASAGAGASQAATPGGTANGGTTPQSTVGQFTNLQDYLNENPVAGSNLAGQVSGLLNTQNTQGQNAINTGVNQFNTDVGSGTVNLNSDLVNSALADPTGFAANPSNVSAFQAQLNPTYSGPASFNADSGAFNPAQQGVANAQQYGNLTGTPQGRETLLSQINPQGTNETGGDLGLDNFFIQSDPNATQTINNANTSLTGLNSQLSAANANSMPQVANAKATTAATGSTVANDLTGAYTGLQNSVNSSVAADQATAAANLAQLKSDLSTNKTLTPAEIAELGVTPEQWAALQSIASQYSTKIGPANNIDIIAAEQLAGFAPTGLAPTGSTQTAQGGLLSNVLSTAGTAVGGAQLANTATGLINGTTTIGDLTGGLLGSTSGGAAEAGGNALDTIGTENGVNGVSNALDAGSGAGEVGGEAAASSAADYLPYAGAAIAIGQIISTGQIGNGQGGLSGALTGAAQGAAIGTAIYPGIGTAIGAAIGAIAGGLFGSAPTVGPNGNTPIHIDASGQLTVGPLSETGHDNGADPNATWSVATQAVPAINQLMQANGWMINPTAHGTTPISIDQGEAGGDNVGAPYDAVGLISWLFQNNMIVADPNSTVDPTNPLNFSSYVTSQTPSTAINAANVATPKNYSDLAALNTLSGQNNQFLLPTNAAQAGTATGNTSLAGFNYQPALTDITNDLSTYNTNAPAQTAAALASLKRGLIT